MAKVKKEEKVEKPKKRKMTRNDKRRLVMKIVSWFMCLIMVAGVVATFLSFFIN